MTLGVLGTLLVVGTLWYRRGTSPIPSKMVNSGSLLCSSKLVSYPAGADIHLDGQYRGKAPVTVSGPCHQKHALKIEMEGYDKDEREFALVSAEEILEFTLEAWTTGTVQVTVAQDTAIYVGEKLRTEAKRNQTVAISLKADEDHRLRFTGRGIASERAYTVKVAQGETKTLTVNLKDK